MQLIVHYKSELPGKGVLYFILISPLLIHVQHKMYHFFHLQGRLLVILSFLIRSLSEEAIGKTTLPRRP